MSEEAQQRLRSRAAAERKIPEKYLQQTVTEALVRDRSKRRAQLECSLNKLLRTYSAEEIAAAAARRIGS
ncbi:hypothetical protein LUX12_04155 [Streptomyces somaliensis]|uniref:hypothetical protein n=1 Tax=Streptomyces somaliensis TaxID=78355 RepID=UPI0020CCAF73|nr:hypothetical protein [Streptomyces somaliensis]MCP9944163.1 hypothetical protein [Streptomyces somaliensis]MCP9962601.1 hypothetical protein [Streptomyces somaliensis]MCP9975430.1 hypothetical protein [Streptomyces somaliensis]